MLSGSFERDPLVTMNYMSLASLIIICSWSLTLDASPLPDLKIGISPHQSAWVTFHEEGSSSVHGAPLKSEDIKDPKKLISAFRENPKLLNAEKMPIELFIQTAQLLMFGGEHLMAMELLRSGRTKWPEDPRVVQIFARLSLTLGTPSYGRVALEPFISKQPNAGHIRYLYALSLFLEGPEDRKQVGLSQAQFNELLTRSPNYVGPDGVTAAQVKQFIERNLTPRLTP
jgi:hypothetical protein